MFDNYNVYPIGHPLSVHPGLRKQRRERACEEGCEECPHPVDSDEEEEEEEEEE